jgi:hypothetical protein
MRRHHHFVEAVIVSWIGVRAAQRYGLLPTALFGLCIAAFCVNPLIGAVYVIAVGFLWLFWQIMRGLGVPFGLAVAFALALIALAGTAHAESWAMRCHNSVDGSDYGVSWHGDSGFVIIAAPGKSPHQYFASGGNGRDGWRGMKALATAHFDNGAELEAYVERPNLASTFTEGGSHILYRDPMGNILTKDACVVTNSW